MHLEDIKQNAIYRGWVQHRRLEPFFHKFRYPIFYLLIDLDQLENIFSEAKFWSYNKYNIANINNNDHDWHDNINPKQSVHNILKSNMTNPPLGKVYILTHPQIAGVCFNPISIYYCYSKDDNSQPSVVLLKVNNTPWNQTHTYLIPWNNKKLNCYFDKDFHVSPFMPMDMKYHIQATSPKNRLKIHIANYNKNNVKQMQNKEFKAFDASLVLKRYDWDSKSLSKLLYQYPLSSYMIYWRIYKQAAVLWFKGAKFYSNPSTTTNY